MPTLGIALTSSPRPGGHNYCDRCVDSTRAAGFTEALHVFAEPRTPKPSNMADVLWHQNGKQRGCFQNFAQAVRYMEATDYEWVLLLQDDVIFRDDAAQQLHAEIATRDPATTGFLSLYTNKSMRPAVADGHEEQWHRPNFYMGTQTKGGKGFWGALATCWPRSTLQRMVQQPRFRDHTHHRKVDVVIGFVCLELDLDVATYVPSLADHIGKASTIGRDKIGNQWGRYGKDFREQA